MSYVSKVAGCGVVKDISSNNSTGFSVLPTGSFGNGEYSRLLL